MKPIRFIYILLIVHLFSACSFFSDSEEDINYTIQVVEELHLPIPSGSGITGYKNGFLTVGDDTPWLYYLDSLGSLEDSLRLSMVHGYVPGVRMDGAFKADFECLTRLTEEIVLIMSSGSYHAARDTAYLVNAEEKRILAKKSMAPLFENFAKIAGLEDRHQLNIEGVAVAEHEIYFFNRADLSDKSMIFKADLVNFISYFTSEEELKVSGNFPITPHHPDYGNSTFSSAFFIPDTPRYQQQFIFSSTREMGSSLTDDGVVDGEIHGSFLGSIRLDELGNSKVHAAPIMMGDSIAPIKVEGLWLYKEVEYRQKYQFIAVSDPDNGTTNAFIIEIAIQGLRNDSNRSK